MSNSSEKPRWTIQYSTNIGLLKLRKRPVTNELFLRNHRGEKWHVCMHMTLNKKVFKRHIETKHTGLEQACDICNCAATRKGHS